MRTDSFSSELSVVLDVASAKKNRRSVTFPTNIVLQQAITDGDEKEIKKAVSEHGSSCLNVQDPTGMPLLLRAVFEDHYDCLELMVAEGADLSVTDDEGWTALHVAVSLEDTESIDLLLHHRPQLLYARTIDGLRPINVCESNDLAAHLLHAEVKLLKSESSQSLLKTLKPLRANSKQEELELLQVVIGAGEDDDSFRSLTQMALHLAAANNYLGLAYYMLQNRMCSVDGEDDEHWTALHLAALHSSMDVLVLLLQYGADVHRLTSSSKRAVDLTKNELTVEFLTRGTDYI